MTIKVYSEMKAKEISERLKRLKALPGKKLDKIRADLEELEFNKEIADIEKGTSFD